MITKNHFLYIIYISCFLPPPHPQYIEKRKKTYEVTLNVQVPKQKKKKKNQSNTEHMPLALLGGWAGG